MNENADMVLLTLASAVAYCDGHVSDREFALLYHLASRVLSPDAASAFLQEFPRLTSEQVLARLEHALDFYAARAYAERLDLLLQGYDFASVDGIAPEELDLLERARERLGITPGDAELCLVAMAPTAVRRTPPIARPSGAPSALRVCHIGLSAPDGIPLPAQVTASAIMVGDTAYVRVVEAEQPVILDDDPILMRRLVRLMASSRVTVFPYTFTLADMRSVLDAAEHDWEEVPAPATVKELVASPMRLWRRGHLLALSSDRASITVNGCEAAVGTRVLLTGRDRYRVEHATFCGSDIVAATRSGESRADFGASSTPAARGVSTRPGAPARHRRVDSVQANGLGLTTRDGTVLLDHISFSFERGSLVAVMGPSGCGKTTLLEVLAGDLRATSGGATVRIADDVIDIDAATDRVVIVPQSEVLFPSLTVREHVVAASRLRDPAATRSCRAERVASAISRVGLGARIHTQVGTTDRRILSGGQRRRVSIAMELVGSPDVLLLDEPLSGLSSHDARGVALLFRDIATRGAIVLMSVHQPSLELFDLFDQVLVMDDGGRVVFVGSPSAAVSHFASHAGQTRWSTSHEATQTSRPDVILAALSQRAPGDHANEIGRPRVYPPYYWQALWHLRAGHASEVAARTCATRRRRSPSLAARWEQLHTVLWRHVLVRLRSRAALLLSLMLATTLGLLLGSVLRKPNAAHGYSYHFNENIAHFLFLTCIVCFFLGMSASCTELLTERRTVLHERRLGVPVGYAVASKFLVLGLVGAAETLLFLAAGITALEMPGPYGWLFVLGVSMSTTGVAVGLFVSSFTRSALVAQACVPLALIPQLLFGGLLPFEKMNPAFHEAAGPGTPRTGVPWPAEVVPARWAYEGMLAAVATNNACATEYGHKHRRIDEDERQPVGSEAREGAHKKRTGLFWQVQQVCPIRGSGSFLDEQAKSAACGCENAHLVSLFNVAEAPENQLSTLRAPFPSKRRTTFAGVVDTPLVALVVLVSGQLMLLIMTAFVLRSQR